MLSSMFAREVVKAQVYLFSVIRHLRVGQTLILKVFSNLTLGAQKRIDGNQSKRADFGTF